MPIVQITNNVYTADPLYQWDKNQVLQILGISVPSNPEIHFSNSAMNNAIVRRATVDNEGIISVEIPNVILETPYKITAYVCVYDGDAFNTLYAVEIPIIKRTKPDDFLPSTEEEIYSYRTLNARIDNILANASDTEGNAELIDIRTGADGTIYNTAGVAVRSQIEKLNKNVANFTEACCDTEIVGGGNYNLLKLSEVSYSSRLQDDVSGIDTSNVNNVVTGWIPVRYGKYYTPSVLYNGGRIVGNSSFALIVRVNVLLDDGSIIVYGNNVTDRGEILYQPGVNETITLVHENAVAVMLHFLIGNNDISTSEKLEAYEPMVIEGDTIEDATSKATSYEYLNGDTEIPAEIEYSMKRDNTKADKVSLSPYYRNVNFGVLPFTYYKGVADSYENSVFGWTTKYADYIALWKSMISNHSGYVTETALGTASDGQTVYLYDFKPVRLSNQDKPIPKIILIAGQHGGETCNIFGLYYFVNNLLNKWHKHPALEYLRNHVELMIIPVLNTYGFDNQSYTNANGVNLNRNYDSKWTLLADTTSMQYGGAEPFDQPETRIVRDLLLSNTDALLVVDSHVNGGGKVAEYSDINYYGVCESTDSYYNRMLDAVAYNLSAISANFNLDYELGQPDTILGFLNNNDGVGLLRNWGTDNNFVSVLVEGFGGFPNGTSYAPEVFKANEEIIVNWLITAVNYLAK